MPARALTDVKIGLPIADPLSRAARSTEALGLVTFHPAEDHVLDLTFDGASHGSSADLRPELPLVLRW